MNLILAAVLLAASPLLAAPAAPAVDLPAAWRQALALAAPQASVVALNARFMQGSPWYDVDDAGLGIRLTGNHTTNGVVKFSGRAGAALTFEARPLDSTQRPYGWQFVSKTLTARIVRFDEGFTLDGRAGGKPLNLTLRRGRMPDRYEIVGRDGTKLDAWITASYADVSGRFNPEKMTPEGMAAMGAAIALMYSSGESARP